MDSKNIPYEVYYELAANGLTPIEVFKVAQSKGLDPIRCMAVVKTVYGLSLIEAKNIMIQAEDPNDSIDKRQARIADELKELIDSLNFDDKGNIIEDE